MYTYYFEKLQVWGNIRELIKITYNITTDFPSEEKYGIKSQMRRAIISVSANLAEGSSISTRKDQSHFTTMSYSSLMELLSLTITSLDLTYINKDEYQHFRSKIDKVSIMLIGLRKSQQNTSKK